MRTLEKEGSTTSERRTGVRRSALPMSAVEQALRSNVADNPFTRSNNKKPPYGGFFVIWLRVNDARITDEGDTCHHISPSSI